MSADDRDAEHVAPFLEALCAEEEPAYVRPCLYCGMPADTVDHIPPRHMRLQLSELALSSLVVKEVPACRECNNALGIRPLLTIQERRAYMRDWIRKRYAKYLRIPHWTEDALLELSPNLRQMVRQGLVIREITKERLRWMR